MPTPVVTGIAPREGPPGTRVTIRGENLGQSQADLIGVAICKKNCTMTAEWISPSKILCRTSFGKGSGDIIVITGTGGMGSSTVKFTGLSPKPVGPNEVSLTWVDETNYIDKRLDRSQKAQFHIRTDPLGINNDDVKSSDTESAYAHMFQKGSCDPTDENFVPTWFLLEKHRQTPFHKLKEGHSYMRKRANRSSNNVPLSHVKESLPVFFEVHDTLSQIHHKMQNDLNHKGNENITDEVEQLLNEASGKADDLFKTVLTSKDRADSIRNTLNVLQRFKFLFHLPLNMDRNIHKGDYGVVINDYEKAKSLFKHTDVAIFKKIYKIVEGKMEEFGDRLRSEVRELPLPLTRQKVLIRFLIGVGVGGDPAWECIHNQHEWIQNSMLACKDKYLDEARKSEGDSKKLMHICEAYHFELSKIATEQLPEHWHLWEQYASGLILSETGEKSSQVDKLKQQANTHAKHMKGLLCDTVALLVNLVRACFLPGSLRADHHGDDDHSEAERSSYGMWPAAVWPISADVLADVIKTSRETHQELSSLNLPPTTLQPLHTLIQDLRVLCLSTFLHEAADEIGSLHEKETWKVDEGGITSLPSMYNEIVSRLLMSISDVQCSLPGEENVLARASFQQPLSQLSSSLFVSFPEAVQRACLDHDSTDHSHSAEKLIIALSNLDFVKENIYPSMFQLLQNHKFPHIELIKQSSDESWRKVRQNIFEVYCERRVEPLVGRLEPDMYVGNFAYEDAPYPKGVRSYVKMIVMKISSLHSEVFAISPLLVGDIMREVVRATSEEVLRLVQCVTSFSTNGALQARLDVEALEHITSNYSTKQSQNSFGEALASIPNNHNRENQQSMEELKRKFEKGIAFQARCLQL